MTSIAKSTRCQIWMPQARVANDKISCPAGRRFLFPCIIPRMDIPDRIITQMELKRSTGERGTRKLIAYQGIVYDVTDCPKWRTDLHEQLHFPGQDLTGELPEAPHQEDVFSRPCVRIIGKLESKALP
jgi:predicted heme/steroid binding protein